MQSRYIAIRQRTHWKSKRGQTPSYTKQVSSLGRVFAIHLRVKCTVDNANFGGTLCNAGTSTRGGRRSAHISRAALTVGGHFIQVCGHRRKSWEKSLSYAFIDIFLD